MNKRLILMPCMCQMWQDKVFALKEVSIMTSSQNTVRIKIKCLFCKKIQVVLIGWKRYYLMFQNHLEVK